MTLSSIYGWLAAVALFLALIEATLAATCSDGFDDVFSSALKHWRENGKQVQTQVS